VGDFLLARGLSIAAETGKTRVIKVIANITENMSQGEIAQLLHKGRLDLTEAQYMEVIRCKTAVLFEGACRISAILADAVEAKEKALATYGYNLGMAFQMVDDLLDYTCDSKALGKTVGADLKEGKLTLPVIYALKAADPDDRVVIEKTITNDFSDEEFKMLIEYLDKYGGITYTQTKAADHIHQAKEALAVFEASATKDILFDVADYALVRKM
jgi:octaprenyl-diphosphate synthase